MHSDAQIRNEAQFRKDLQAAIDERHQANHPIVAKWEGGVTSELSGGKLVASALALPAGGQGRNSPVYGNTERQCGQSSLSRG